MFCENFMNIGGNFGKLFKKQVVKLLLGHIVQCTGYIVQLYMQSSFRFVGKVFKVGVLIANYSKIANNENV